MNLTTSFDTLGIDPGADEAQAKRAYKAQVRRWHPDQFPEGSATKAGAEEQLKQINVAYARIKVHLAKRRPDPSHAANASPTPPRQNTTVRNESHGEKSRKRSWANHLFDALNAFAGNRSSEPPIPPPPPGRTDTNRGQSFGQVLDEMAGGKIYPKPKRQSRHPAAARRATTGYRHHSGAVDGVGSTESPGPVKPVGRVRGIGRSR